MIIVDVRRGGTAKRFGLVWFLPEREPWCEKLSSEPGRKEMFILRL